MRPWEKEVVKVDLPRVQKLTKLKLSVPWALACVTCRENQHSWPQKASGLTLKANVDGKDQNKTLYLLPFASEKRFLVSTCIVK